MNLREKYRSVATLDGKPYKGGFAVMENGRWRFISEATLRGLLFYDGLPLLQTKTFITSLLGGSFAWDGGMVFITEVKQWL